MGYRVRVYWNVHKECWSIQRKAAGQWRVVDWAERITLAQVTWIVGVKGRDRVRANNRKVVHAFAEGTVMDEWTPPKESSDPIYYNPYKHDLFQVDGGPLYLCNAATFDRYGKAYRLAEEPEGQPRLQ